MQVRKLEKRLIKQSFANASQSYDGMAGLQRRVGCELIKWVKLPYDALVLDIGCGTGFFTQQLLKKAGIQNLLALDIALPMLWQTRHRPWLAKIPLVCADAEQLPFADNSLDGVTANLALQWCHDIDSLFRHVRRILRTNGQFVFSTFGPEALSELKLAWAEVDNFPHVNEFLSLQDIQQSLLAAGFANIYLESKVYRIKYADVIELMRELKGIGAHNVHYARNKRLTSKGQLQGLLSAYPQNIDGQVEASFEIIYVQTRA